MHEQCPSGSLELSTYTVEYTQQINFPTLIAWNHKLQQDTCLKGKKCHLAWHSSSTFQLWLVTRTVPETGERILRHVPHDWGSPAPHTFGEYAFQTVWERDRALGIIAVYKQRKLPTKQSVQICSCCNTPALTSLEQQVNTFLILYSKCAYC